MKMAMSASEKKKEDWMNTKWRPMMGWMYMAVCIFDFILAPILWSAVQFWESNSVNDAFRQWQPLTLQGAGLFHMAMGAVLGLSAWGRTQEKIGGNAGAAAESNYTPPETSAPQPVSPSYTPTYTPAAMSSTGKAKPMPQVDEPL